MCLNGVMCPRINIYVRLRTFNPWVKAPATSNTAEETGAMYITDLYLPVVRVLLTRFRITVHHITPF
jgi:hypothetical protein